MYLISQKHPDENLKIEMSKIISNKIRRKFDYYIVELSNSKKKFIIYLL